MTLYLRQSDKQCPSAMCLQCFIIFLVSDGIGKRPETPKLSLQRPGLLANAENTLEVPKWYGYTPFRDVTPCWR